MICTWSSCIWKNKSILTQMQSRPFYLKLLKHSFDKYLLLFGCNISPHRPLTQTQTLYFRLCITGVNYVWTLHWLCTVRGNGPKPGASWAGKKKKKLPSSCFISCSAKFKDSAKQCDCDDWIKTLCCLLPGSLFTQWGHMCSVTHTGP